MIYVKDWIRVKGEHSDRYYYKGYFLFGFIPLWIERTNLDGVRP